MMVVSYIVAIAALGNTDRSKAIEHTDHQVPRDTMTVGQPSAMGQAPTTWPMLLLFILFIITVRMSCLKWLPKVIYFRNSFAAIYNLGPVIKWCYNRHFWCAHQLSTQREYREPRAARSTKMWACCVTAAGPFPFCCACSIGQWMVWKAFFFYPA